jgi:hypothetical protein
MIKAIEDPRLAELSKICLALPHAERSVSGDHAGFRVRGLLRTPDGVRGSGERQAHPVIAQGPWSVC